MQRQRGSDAFEGAAFLLGVILILVSLTGISLAQGGVPGDYQIGFPEQGEFGGSDFENVQMNNNNLHIEVPLWTLGGRGPSTGYKYVYDSRGWAYNEACNKRTGDCADTVSPQPLGHDMGCCDHNNLQFPLVSSFEFGGASVRATANCNAGNVLVYSFYLNAPEGTHHHFVPDPVGPSSSCPNGWTYATTVYADDGSGWIMHVDPSSGGVLSVVEKDGTATVSASIEDANGNEILVGSPITDTLGRQIPSGTSFYDSSGALRNIQVTGQNVAIQTNLCQFSGETCHEYSGTFFLPQVITLPNGMSYTFTYDQGSPTHPYYGQPLSVTLPTGGQITWGWSGEQRSGPLLTTRLLTGDPGPWKYSGWGLPTLAPTTVTDPAGNDTVYTYADHGSYNTADSTDVIEKQYYQGSSTSGTLVKTVQTDYQLTNTLPVLPIHETTTWNQQNLVSRTETDYDSWPIPGWTGFSASASNPVEKREYDYGTGSWGSLIRTTDYGYLHLSNSTYLGLNILDKETSKKIYAGSSGSGTLTAQTLNTYDGVAIAGNTSGTPAPNHDYTNYPSSYNYRGNLTQVSKGLLSGSTWTWLNTNNTYNDLGEILTSTDPLSHQTTYDYTDAWATISNPQCVTSAHSYGFPTTITDALGHQTKHTYYSCTSLTGSTQDANDIAASRPGTTFSYDLMSRGTAVNYPDGGQTTFSYNDAVPYSKTSTQLITSSMSKVSTVVHDGLGRVQQTQLVDPDCSSGPVKVDYTYSYDPSPPSGIPAGKFTTVSNPYCQTSDATYGITKTRYDALERPVLVIPPDGSDTANNVSTTYSGTTTGLTATATDQVGAARTSQTDALGRMTYVWEDPTTADYETDYSYNVLDDLTGVTQKGGSTSSNWRTRSFLYDSLGRLTQSINPESGTINYTYDADSNLKTKIVPSPNQPATGTATVTTTYNYDALNRLTGKSYSDTYTSNPPTAAASYGYDGTALSSCTTSPPTLADSNPIGLRTAMCDGSGATSWKHDPMNRPLQERRTIGTVSGDYETDIFNLDGSVASLTALGYGATFTYNQAAHSLTTTHSTTKFVSGATYAPQGAIASEVFGSATGFNGIAVADTYNKRLQPSTITATLPSNALVQSLTYNFNLGTADNGNVYSVTNGKDATRSQTFTYDKLNRITTAATQGTTGSTCWGQKFGYMSNGSFVLGPDPWGNLTQIQSTQCSSLTLNQAITTKNQFASPMVYDAAGNLINDGSHPYTYDAENRLTTANGVTYTYDGDGKRVKKSSGTLYWTGPGWDPLVETDLSGNVTANYLFFNGERVARVDQPAGTVEYYFSDHLKSTDIVTNATGGIVHESDYVPYGGEIVISGTDPNHYKFTGKERDPESGLDDFDARFYSSPFGRFMTPDWAAKPTDVPYANFGNPQSLNLYSYVQNNPTTTGDPDGHDCDACASFMNFASAAANAWTSDNALGAGRQTQTTETGRIGAAVGDFGATVTGGVETLVGGGGNVGGLALDSTGVGALAGVPLNVASTGLMVHGGATTAAGFYNLFKQGGTYTLRDDDNKVQRSGRTNDLDRRQGEHARAEETKDLKFKTQLKTNSKAAQRGHEQMLHDQHQPSLNKVQPISPNNPNKAAYMKAAKKRLKNN